MNNTAGLLMDGEVMKIGPKCGRVGVHGSTSSMQVVLQCEAPKAITLRVGYIVKNIIFFKEPKK